MPAGYSARCRVCNSPHRVEIERWCKEEGLSPRAAAAKLLEQHKEKITHVSIWKHMNEHFDVRAEAREQYQKSQRQMQQLAQKQVSDIEMLNSIARGEYELHQAARLWLDELVAYRAKIPKTLVDLFAVTAGEVRQQLRQKQVLLGEDSEGRLADAMVATLEELQELYLNAHRSQEEADS